ncbi:alcohol dehydrogenase catalytic domain-containing protein [Pasteurella canis]|uniref:zinc-binding dehydrogenase n=1 Tax=Pasteurella canis TaxID=753 RepID=UPI001D100770|nr:alcohol dehydrogenase catalytic domain-containing protein [Pasteurella canis]UDW84646.1 alcohol dehydrogenase catalytic domain-containing protein [Pasteurella canis]
MKNSKIPCIKVSGAHQIELTTTEINNPLSNETVVKVIRGGICGSDIHYYQEGGVGSFNLKHPMILGHEVVGYLENKKQAVAINPSKPCLQCQYCLNGKSNQCLNMRFFGSAMLTPHVDGGFAKYILVRNDQIIPYQDNIPSRVMVFAEPLAVAIHAVNQAGSLVGKKVLVTGCGPIGSLVVAACKQVGAVEIIASDIQEACRKIGMKMGATSTINPLEQNEHYFTDKGYFDVTFEASGANEAINFAIDATKATGTIIQIGMSKNNLSVPLTKFLAKEITYKGAFRFTDEFNIAVRWLELGLIDPLPLLSHEFPYQEVEKALQIAGDKNVAIKVQLNFEEQL